VNIFFLATNIEKNMLIKNAHKKLTIALPWMPTLPLGRTNEDCSHTTAKHNKTTLKNCKT
jgi:hypothetical protein